ncbi:hypothetical protein ACFQW6_03705 [Nocardioides sp. GCM10028917]|uniref:hypothetical protein n=1 Tax=Nocardioides sp. GCM10028917 TaxID=3273408 RepID=UPI003610D61F
MTLVKDTKKNLRDGRPGPISTQVGAAIDLDRLTADPFRCRHVEDRDDVAPIMEEWVAQAARERLGHFPHRVGLEKLEPMTPGGPTLARTGRGPRPD